MVAVSVERFTYESGGINWYCERRGAGAAVVLVPSGEGDCGVYETVAATLADQFTVLTFDIPGFSRSSASDEGLVSFPRLAGQIAELLTSLGVPPATFYGNSSGGRAILDLVVDHRETVRNAIVHEVPLTEAMVAHLATLSDAEAVEACKFTFANLMNEDSAAWQALGDEYHARLEKNYLTWVRRYIAAGLPPVYAPEQLAGQPITWTIGGLTPSAAFLDNAVLAVKAGLSIDTLPCMHFPQVSQPLLLAEHIQAIAVSRPGSAA